MSNIPDNLNIPNIDDKIDNQNIDDFFNSLMIDNSNDFEDINIDDILQFKKEDFLNKEDFELLASILEEK